MLDVHPPHGKMHGVGDFLLHLFTITIGLLIALGLEGCVERLHHRHLVHEAETGMRREIAENAHAMPALRQQVSNERKELDANLAVLAQIKTHPTAKPGQFSVTFRMQNFDEVTWKTAQTTGAFALMPYADANLYSTIYGTQAEVDREQRDIVTDLMRVGSFVINCAPNEVPTPTQIEAMKQQIGMVQFRLLLLSSFLDNLEREYGNFLKDHPAA